MKKTLRIAVFVLSAFLLASCSSKLEKQMKRDAEDVAKRIVEYEQVSKNREDPSKSGGEMISVDEFKKLENEYLKYIDEMYKKYDKTVELKRQYKDLVEQKVNELKNQ